MENAFDKIDENVAAARSKVKDLDLTLKKLNENENTSEGGFYITQDRIHNELAKIFEQFPELEKEYEQI